MLRSILAGLALAILTTPALAAGDRTVVVLVFDGAAPALLADNPTPAFDRMRAEGAWSHGLEPAFPTISLINGFTLSTGCWPANHGIVTNKFRDPVRGLYDHAGYEADWLIGCEGLHEVAERQDVRAAALGWYGRKSETRGDLASVVTDHDFQSDDADTRRAEEVVVQLARQDAGRPRLVLAYFSGPDGAEHLTGQTSDETRAKVAAMDANVGRIMDAIQATGRPTSLIVTTDHGMHDVTHIVNVQRLLHWHGIEAEPVSTGTTSFLYLSDETDVDRAAAELSGYDEFEVLRADALPEYARLGNSGRVPPLILSARPPYFIEDMDLWPGWLRWMGRWGPRFVWARPFLKATHGYPPDVEGMHGVLYAWGDGIAAAREVPHLRAIDLHPTVTHLLGIQPGKPVDGSVVRGLLAGATAR